MSWKGALAGGALGACFGGPLGAVIGATVGHLFTNEEKKQPSPEATPGDQKQALFVIALFSTLAKLAKADGVVSFNEATMLKSFIAEHFKPEERTFIREVFNTARDNDVSFENYCDELVRIVGNDREFKLHFLGVLCELAAADGGIKPEEEKLLFYAERAFGLPGYVRTFFQYGGSAAETPNNLTVYYEILGCTESATEEEVKAAYRKKCRDFHPDRIQAKGLPEEFISFAEKEMQRINQAYEEIKKSRNMR